MHLNPSASRQLLSQTFMDLAYAMDECVMWMQSCGIMIYLGRILRNKTARFKETKFSLINSKYYFLYILVIS